MNDGHASVYPLSSVGVVGAEAVGACKCLAVALRCARFVELSHHAP